MAGEVWFWIAAIVVTLVLAVWGLFYPRWKRDEPVSRPSSATIILSDWGWFRGLVKLRARKAEQKREVDAMRSIAREKNHALHRQLEKDLMDMENRTE